MRRGRRAPAPSRLPPLMTANGRYCCKSILTISSRNIDSRSGAGAQQRFKEARAPIRLLQITISQSLLGDFCNNIGTERRLGSVRSYVSFGVNRLDILRLSLAAHDPNRTLPRRNDCSVPYRRLTHSHDTFSKSSSRKQQSFQSKFCNPRSSRRILTSNTAIRRTHLITLPRSPLSTHTLRESINVDFATAKKFKKI